VFAELLVSFLMGEETQSLLGRLYTIIISNERAYIPIHTETTESVNLQYVRPSTVASLRSGNSLRPASILLMRLPTLTSSFIVLQVTSMLNDRVS